MMLIKNVFKRFGGVKALQGCSLEIEKGKITALIGPNGSGKSTLFNAISALITKDRGKIEL
ncbi:MAG: ATP-binding cassette domain-containing protein, partial [Anaerolineales bacterium]|nr:ATP-binding cassette domain-containing protein [Anaerolineales bacterium]